MGITQRGVKKTALQACVVHIRQEDIEAARAAIDGMFSPVLCRGKSGRMPENPYKSRLFGQFIPRFCADFVPKPILHTKNCLFRKGSPIPKNEKTLENQGFSYEVC